MVKIITCSNCNNEIDSTNKFCPNCGTEINSKITCSKCNTEIESSCKFCPNCAEPCNTSDHISSKDKNKNEIHKQIICKKCKKDILVSKKNAKDITCPHCGANTKIKSNTGCISAIMQATIGIFILIVIISIAIKPNNDNTTTTNTDQAITETLTTSTTKQYKATQSIKVAPSNAENADPTFKTPPITIEEQYKAIKDTPDFKAYIDFKGQISTDKELGTYTPFQDDPEYDRKYSQLKPKYNKILSEKYNINFDIDSFEEKNLNHLELRNYHASIIEKNRAFYLEKQYNSLKNNTTFKAYLDFDSLYHSQQSQIDESIQTKLGNPPTDPSKLSDYQKKYIELDKKLWEYAIQVCNEKLSEQYNIVFDKENLDNANPEWKEIFVWYKDNIYEEQRINEQKHAVEEGMNALFSNIHITEYSYKYYINPQIWFSINYDQKENLFIKCALYGKSKYPNDTMDDIAYSLIKVKILNYTNGKILGEYDAWGGYSFE